MASYNLKENHVFLINRIQVLRKGELQMCQESKENIRYLEQGQAFVNNERLSE